ncbi:MAG: class I SAM-dependent methyltransferase [Candidatus Dojkabacteria bacterium]
MVSSSQCVSEFNRYSEQVACIGANPDVVFRAELGDVFSMDFEEGVYDLVLMAQLFVHEPDKGKMVELLNTTTRALKPGGYLWLRTSGTADSEFENFIERANRNPALRYHDCHDVFWEYCGCTGEMKLEPISFLNAGGLAQVVTESGLRIVHSQIGPTKGDANIMYGENWIPEEHRDYGYWLNTRGFITFIAQKPQI